MPSPLSFDSTENFRKKLLVKNLEPYKSNGFNSTTAPGTDEFSLKDFSVLDSPDIIKVGDQQEQILYTKNKYGPANGQNGFGDPIDVTTLQTNSNEGPYTGIDTGLELRSEPLQKRAFINNLYGPQDGLVNVYSVDEVQKLIQNRDTYFKFIASTYPVSGILLQDNPQGSNGSLSQDSDMIKIAATSLRAELQYRIAQETYQQTLGRVNLVGALNDPFEAAAILAGKKPLITADWHISVPGSLPAKGLDMAGRLTGIYFPYSWIPGDYFDTVGKKSFINQTINAVGALFGKPDLLPERKNGSDIFLANSGQGQVSALFSSLEYNDYRPDYKANFIGDLNLGAPNGHYYVGKRTQDPNDIIFPNNELPTNAKGQRVQTAVRGYGELATLYEGNQKFNFGLDTSEPSDDGGLQGGFTWVSPKSKDAAGKKAGKGGELYETDSNWPQISSQFNKSESTNYGLTPGSILYDTQKLVDAADGLNGNARLQHVGNAINQTSKVFFDGTREITKGSRVKRYVTEGGKEVGMEYCRVFTKDTPFFTYSDLQKTEGNIRKSTYSVLDNTYNLNIAPMKGNDSTNIIDGQVKKYMLSLENLAWRTSDMQQDLPGCEKGPLGGRIMWFPPYDLRVDESVSVRWNQNDFLGRPEPIYTYNNTQRQGSLSFKIVVDHPSILNTIVDRELANVTPESEITKIVDSFFAGCKTYDIYELAKKYGTLSFNEIFSVVEQTTNIEQFKAGMEETPKEQPEKASEGESIPSLTEYDGLNLYFDNDTPDAKTYGRSSSVDYTTTYMSYVSEKSYYEQQANENQKQPTQTFFDEEITPSYDRFQEFLNRVVEIGNQGYSVSFGILGSASSPNSEEYNVDLSWRRVDSVLQTILGWNGMGALKEKKLLNITTDGVGEGLNSNGIDCNQTLTGQDLIYSVNAMGCRRAQILNIKVDPKIKSDSKIEDEVIPQPTTGDVDASPSPQKTVTNQELSLKQGLAKKMLRKLLSECDYFEMIKEDTPFLYESMKEKIQFFNPAFHSITPEGLNSRLTFLQQCLRPGNTIPTIGPDGTPLKNNALNTSFGAPPICVLRVGDFWHTKIAINQMTIRYEPLQLDLNPEGIGVQPMLADVSLSFYFIGGHGLKEPVTQLQNALSFNYYANTEMYDERAYATEDTSQIDRFVIEDLLNEIPLTNQDMGLEAQNEAGNTIGTIQNKVISDSGTTVTGTTSFMQIMDNLIEVSKAYADGTVSALASVNEAYLTGGLRMFTKDRKYITGDFGQYASSSSDSVETNIFGKTEALQSKIDQIFADALQDVDDENSPLVVPFYQNNAIKNSDLRTYKKQVKDLINARKANFSSSMLSNLNDLVNIEQNFIRVVDKINLVQSGIDGFKKTSGQPIIYSLTATTEVSETSTGATTTQEELVNDYKTVAGNLNDFYDNLEIYDLMIDGWSDNNADIIFYDNNIATGPEKRWAIIFGRETIDNSADISEAVLKDLAKIPTWANAVYAQQNLLVGYYESEYAESLKQFDKFRDEYFKSVFNEYKPYVKGKQRDFTFSDVKSPNPADLDNFNSLYSGVNGGNKNSWNNKVKLD